MVIGIAGALGVLLRYYVGIWIPTSWILNFPLGSLLINLVGSFFLSWFTVWSTCYSSMPTWFKTGITTGFIRSFTIFSTLQWESIQMRNEKNSKNFFGTLGLVTRLESYVPFLDMFSVKVIDYELSFFREPNLFPLPSHPISIIM
ncbi:fluoride efflux transporter FluC [Shimazuella alba]|nr:CrcB family protein [Shimazuella alba]